MSLVEKQRRQAILQHQYALQQQQLSAMFQQQQQQQQLLRHMGHPMMVQQQFVQPSSAFGSLPLGGDSPEDKGVPQLGHHEGFQRVNQEYPGLQAGQGSSVLSYGAAGGAGGTYFASNGATMLGQGGGGGGGSPLVSIHPGQASQASRPPITMSR